MISKVSFETSVHHGNRGCLNSSGLLNQIFVSKDKHML